MPRFSDGSMPQGGFKPGPPACVIIGTQGLFAGVSAPDNEPAFHAEKDASPVEDSVGGCTTAGHPCLFKEMQST